MKKNRIAREKETVELMIRLYCRKKKRIPFFAPTAKNCCAMHTPVSTVARSVKKEFVQEMYRTLLQTCHA